MTVGNDPSALARTRPHEGRSVFVLFSVLVVAIASLLLVPGTAHALGGQGILQPTTSDRFAYESVAAGCGHTIVAQPNGTVSAWGENGAGQLGNGGTTDATSPILVMRTSTIPLQNVIAVAAGCEFSLALRSDGTVWAWGRNSNGQLGDGTTTDSLTAVQVRKVGATPLDQVRSIAAGDTWGVAVADDGRMLTWGDNASNQLGRGTGPADETYAAVVKASSGGPDVTNVVQVAPGPSFPGPGRETTYLTANGQWWHFGQESTWPVQYNTSAVNTIGYKSIAVGGSYTTGGNRYGLLANGKVAVWGQNATGELGRNSVSSVSFAATPVYLRSGVATDLVDITAVAAGPSHMLAVDADGSVWSAGSDVAGATGRGDFVGDTRLASRVYKSGTTNMDPQGMVAAGMDLSLTLDAGGRIQSWGANASGQLGVGNTTPRAFAQLASSYVPDIAMTGVIGADQSSALLRSDGAVFTSGANLDNSLGIGQSSIPYDNGDRFVKLAFGGARIRSLGQGIGERSAYQMIDEQGRSWGWGANYFYQVGRNVNTAISSPVLSYETAAGTNAVGVIGAGAGESLRTVLHADGTGWASGYNRCRGGGVAWNFTHDSAGVFVPSAPPTAGHTSTPNTSILLTSWLGMSVSQTGRTGLGKVVACGSNFEARGRPLGFYSGTVDQFYHSYGVVGSPNGAPGTACATTATCSNTTMWDTESAIQLAPATNTTVAVTAQGQMWSWGYGPDYQLGNGANSTSVAPQRPQFSAGVNADHIIGAAGGWQNFFGITSSGTGVAWGTSSYAYCRGLGPTTPYVDPSIVTNVKAVALGRWDNVIGLHANGRPFVCGGVGNENAWGRCNDGTANAPFWIRPGCAPAAPVTLASNQATYTESDTVALTFQVTDPDTDEYLVPWVQIVPAGGSFTEPDCATYDGVTSWRGTQLAAAIAASPYTYTVNVTGLSYGTYKWRACAMDMYGNSTPWTNAPSTFIVDDGIAPSPATSTLLGVADSSTQITWSTGVSTDAGVGLHATPYCISIKVGAGAFGAETCYASNVRIASGLLPNTVYTARVRVRDLVPNYTAMSTDVIVQTPPAPPTGLSTSAITDVGIQFAWTAAAGASAHAIYVYTDAGCTTPIAVDSFIPVAMPAVSFAKSTGIAADRGYWFHMRSYSAAGGYSEPSTCTAISGTNGRSALTVASTGNVALGAITPGGTSQGTTTINVTSNASPGFNLFITGDGQLRSVTDEVDPIGVGSVGTPATWSGTGFGFSVVSGPGAQVASRWGSGTKFAPVPLVSSQFLDSGALATGVPLVTGTTIQFRADVPSGGSVPDAGNYAMTATVLAVGKP